VGRAATGLETSGALASLVILADSLDAVALDDLAATSTLIIVQIIPTLRWHRFRLF
jgi:hypothetical protein